MSGHFTNFNQELNERALAIYDKTKKAYLKLSSNFMRSAATITGDRVRRSNERVTCATTRALFFLAPRTIENVDICSYLSPSRDD